MLVASIASFHFVLGFSNVSSQWTQSEKNSFQNFMPKRPRKKNMLARKHIIHIKHSSANLYVKFWHTAVASQKLSNRFLGLDMSEGMSIVVLGYLPLTCFFPGHAAPLDNHAYRTTSRKNSPFYCFVHAVDPREPGKEESAKYPYA